MVERRVAVAVGAVGVARGGERGEIPEPRGGDRRGRAVVDPVGAFGHVEVPGRDEPLRTPGQETVGIPPRDLQVGRVARIREDRAESVERPGQAARPGRIGAESLLRRLAEECRRSPGRRSPRGPWSRRGGRAWPRSSGSAPRPARRGRGRRPARGVEDQRDVHHDVDEQTLRRQERAEVAALGVESHRQRPPGRDQDLAERRVAGQPIPGQVGIEEDEAEVVDVAIVLAVFQEPRVVLGRPPPPGIAVAASDQPHHPGVEAAAPVGPELAAMLPPAVLGVDREVVGVTLDRRAHLPRGELEGSPQARSQILDIDGSRLGQ